MADKMRWRYGEVNSVVANVDSATVISLGDLLYLANGKALPASALTPSATISETQKAFSAAFLGVAMQKSAAGSAEQIRVATTGIFEFDAPSQTYGLGDKVGIYEAEAGADLPSQKVDKVTNANEAFGRICRVESSNTTTVLVTIQSVVMNGAYA